MEELGELEQLRLKNMQLEKNLSIKKVQEISKS